ncbi:MAG: NAD(P)H-dependent oxidoreductase [Ilumatobacteraceae bacterium]
MDGERRRVLMVCGSLQRRSANRALLDAIAGELGGAADVAWFDGLATVPAFDADHADDPHPMLDEWRHAVAAADVVVIAVPEYAGGMAGTLKNTLDWLVGSGGLYRKPVAVLSAGTSGGEHARRQTAQTLTWQGAYVIAQLGVAAPRTKFDDDGHLTDASTRTEIAAAAASITAAATKSAAELAPVAVELLAELGLDADHVAPA